MPSGLTQAEYIGHRIQSRMLLARPQRRADRAASEDHAVLGPVGNLDALRWSSKDHGVIAHYRAPAQRGKADVAGPARAGVTVTASHGMLGKIDSSALSRCLPGSECAMSGILSHS